MLHKFQNIGYGETKTYKEVFEDLNIYREQPIGSVRSVAGAIGHNPISIIIPCHRVLGSNDSLTGYADGLERKRFLLDLEK